MSASEAALSALPAIPRDDDGPVFAEPWQAQAFAMAVRLNEQGVFTWKEWAEALSSEITKDHSADAHEHYYVHWLAALEKMLECKGVMSQTERLERIAAWDGAAKGTPHGQPIELGSRTRRTKDGKDH